MAIIKCPECGREVSNQAVSCPHCGFPLDLNGSIPHQVNVGDVVFQPDQPAVPKKNPKILIPVVIAAVLILLLGSYFGCYTGAVKQAREENFSAADKLLFASGITRIHNSALVDYVNAGTLFEEENYQDAQTAFAALEDYENAQELEQRCRYRYALQLSEDRNFDKAIQIMSDLKYEKYEDADTQLNQIKFAKAEFLLDNKNYVDACSILAGLDKEQYSPASQKLDETKELIYQDAIGKYQNGSYTESESLFRCVENYDDANVYLGLLSARNANSANDAKDAWDFLKDHFYFEDAAQIALTNEYVFEAYMLGEWKADGYYYTFTMYDDLGISTYLPWIEYGDYYRIEDGVFLLYYEDDYNDTRELFTVKIRTPDRIEMYCHRNETNYIMNRVD